ncbi:unnamed protein product [Didymodactylos carnosus]|uniref:Uncharacterized protein n=1 Tax=Didymodactylos carnosus TaxID=1234261 RepID=A0A813RYX5_9BILA|nr:unnamed protein product [Didymodactylos carnosus]CAF0792238.1 unnamed protein product [Didymodactylos carnosus]CAF3518518.1 unnamed protein product [Didymodactylos carnosus]CAF3576492.1 unnamed protein product [Didymodactylos carnosus]
MSASDYIDRSDYDQDHYSDILRNSNRSRLTLEQLEIYQRQNRKTTKLLENIHRLRMKERDRVTHAFIRHVNDDKYISKLKCVQDTLKVRKYNPNSTASSTNNSKLSHRTHIENEQNNGKQLNSKTGQHLHEFEAPSKTKVKNNYLNFMSISNKHPLF